MIHVDFRRQEFARLRRFVSLKLGVKQAVGYCAPFPRPRRAPCRPSELWRRCGECLVRALQAAGETPRPRLAPGLPAELAAGAVGAASLAARVGGSCAAPAGPSVGPSAQRTLGAEVLGPRRPGRRSPGPSLAQAPKTWALIGPGAEVLGPCWPGRRRHCRPRARRRG